MSNQNFTKSRLPSYGTIGSGEIPRERNGKQVSTNSQNFDSLPFEERAAQHGVYISLPSFSDDEDDEEERDYPTLLNEYLITTPFIILTLISFILLLYTWPTTEGRAEHYQWDILLLGATGWCAVYLVRRPIFFIFSKLISLKVSTSAILTLGFIGFLEEFIRMGWIYYFVNEKDKFLTVYWLGLGWA